jgi:hypothetical protein
VGVLTQLSSIKHILRKCMFNLNNPVVIMAALAAVVEATELGHTLDVDVNQRG